LTVKDFVTLEISSLSRIKKKENVKPIVLQYVVQFVEKALNPSSFFSISRKEMGSKGEVVGRRLIQQCEI